MGLGPVLLLLSLVSSGFTNFQTQHCGPDIVRLGHYSTVRSSSLHYDDSKIFKDPRDTETIAAVGLHSVQMGDVVLELGSGSGIPTQAFATQGGASRVVGLDVSAESVAYATSQYFSDRIAFFQADYTSLSVDEIVTRFLNGAPPQLVVSNPPYVPSVGFHSEGLLRTIDGGPDGLKFVRRVIDIASELKSKVAFILGSYSSPIDALRLLEQKNYEVTALTFSALPFGSFSKANKQQILKLEGQGKAYLLRSVFPGQLGYLAIGIEARPSTAPARLMNPSNFAHLLIEICRSKSMNLEFLPRRYPVPIRVLNLPDQPYE